MLDCPECGEYIAFDDVSTTDLLEELQDRLTRRSANNSIWGKPEIKQWIIGNFHETQTLLDQQKNELFEEARERFTIAELTERLKP